MTQNLGLQGKLHMEDWGLCAPSSTPSLWGRAPIIAYTAIAYTAIALHG